MLQTILDKVTYKPFAWVILYGTVILFSFKNVSSHLWSLLIETFYFRIVCIIGLCWCLYSKGYCLSRMRFDQLVLNRASMRTSGKKPPYYFSFTRAKIICNITLQLSIKKNRRQSLFFHPHENVSHDFCLINYEYQLRNIHIQHNLIVSSYIYIKFLSFSFSLVAEF